MDCHHTSVTFSLPHHPPSATCSLLGQWSRVQPLQLRRLKNRNAFTRSFALAPSTHHHKPYLTHPQTVQPELPQSFSKPSSPRPHRTSSSSSALTSPTSTASHRRPAPTMSSAQEKAQNYLGALDKEVPNSADSVHPARPLPDC